MKKPKLTVHKLGREQALTLLHIFNGAGDSYTLVKFPTRELHSQPEVKIWTNAISCTPFSILVTLPHALEKMTHQQSKLQKSFSKFRKVLFLRSIPNEASNMNLRHQVVEAHGCLKEPQLPQLGVHVVSAVLVCNLKLTTSLCVLLNGYADLGPDVNCWGLWGEAQSSLSGAEKTWALKFKPLEGPSASTDVYHSLPQRWQWPYSLPPLPS